MNADLSAVAEVAREAGAAILEIYRRDFSVEEKEDKSPLTEADRRANEIILAGLERVAPGIPFITEETKARPYSERASWPELWLIDPLDGTKEFIKKNGEFTVNIALVRDGVPVLGVVFQPATGTFYLAESGRGARKITADGSESALNGGPHYTSKDTIHVVASRSHMSPETEAFVDDLRQQGKQIELASAGSSLKICLVAEGTADVYPRFAPTMEWDTAAAHAVALEAGRSVFNRETGEPLQYNKENLLNPWFIVE